MNRAKLLAPIFAVMVALALFLAPPAKAAPAEAYGLQTFSSSASAGLAIVNTATGQSIHPRALVLRSSSGGVVVIRSGSNSGTVLLRLYLPTDVTVVIPGDALGGLDNPGGPVIGTTSGECLFVSDISATITGWVLYTTQ